MALDSYYLTRAEYEIFQREASALAAKFTGGSSSSLELIELGAGDGTKSKLLLAELMKSGADFSYRPVDISSDILEVLAADLKITWPTMGVRPMAQTYFEALEQLEASPGVRRVVLFLGSNIGNFSLPKAQGFCRQIFDALHPGDMLLVGVDLRKDPRLILRAYDDDEGVTAAFNLNLLHRANRELSADFGVSAWGFYPLYNPETGEVRSYLYPRSAQHVRIASCGVDRVFEVGEVIHTEVSRKYSIAELASLPALDFPPKLLLTDAAGLFADAVWTK